jgi:DNA-binding NarL/FixJ family response regulator
MPVTVVLADDSPVFLAGMARAFERDPRIDLVAVAADGDAALLAVLEHAPDVAVLDVAMPAKTGSEVCERLRAMDHDVPVLLLSALHGDDLELVRERAGAAAAMPKTCRRADVCMAVAELGQLALHG